MEPAMTNSPSFSTASMSRLIFSAFVYMTVYGIAVSVLQI